MPVITASLPLCKRCRVSTGWLLALVVTLSGCVHPGAVTFEPRGFSTSYERYTRPAPPPRTVALENPATRTR